MSSKSQFGNDYEGGKIKITKRANASSEVLGGVAGDFQNDGKDETTEEQKLFEKVFSIPLLLKEILKNLESPDLLRTSFVNRSWNFFSREVLRESKICRAAFKDQNSCHRFQKLNALLLDSETVPFNGLSISASSSGPHHQCVVYRNGSALFNSILQAISIKYLSMDCQRDPSCGYLNFIREIFVQRASFLEGLRLQDIPYRLSLLQFVGLRRSGQWLPKVRILEFPFILYGNDLPKIFVKELVEASPKLQELHGNITVGCLEFVLPLNLARAVKDFNFKPTINSLRNCVAFSMENPKLTKFCLSTSHGDDETLFSGWDESDQNDVITIVKQLLEISQDSLEKIALDHLDLIIMIYKWKILPILQNVVHLSLRYGIGIDCFERTATLEKIDWAKYFPNLKEVSVTNTMFDQLDRDFYVSNAFRGSQAKFVCESVTTFRSAGSMLYQYEDRAGSHLHMFKHVFPNVKEFHLKEFQQLAQNLNELWTAWTDLESIYICVDAGNESGSVRTMPSEDNDYSWDSVILGVDKAEVNYLLKHIEEFGSLEIVPIKPSIFNLRKLKKLQIRLFHSCESCPNCKRRSSSSLRDFLTRLAGQCGFRRLPGLSVEICRHVCIAGDDCYMDLKQLKPFVKFVESNIGLLADKSF